ncbi:hypothetical protein ES708_33444 [subsurface metagenome]
MNKIKLKIGGKVEMSKAYKNCKKDIEKLSDYNRGFYTSFWLGWIHCLAELGKITEEEGMELENFLMDETAKNIIPQDKLN